MKNYIIIIIVCVLFLSCSTSRESNNKEISYSEYSKKDLPIVHSNNIGFEYETIGKFNIKIKPQKYYTIKYEYNGKKYKIKKKYKSKDSIINEMYNLSLFKAADGVVHLKSSMILRIRFKSYDETVVKETISGKAVKRK